MPNMLKMVWHAYDTMRRLARLMGIVLRSELWSDRMNLDCGGLWLQGWRVWTSSWEWPGAPGNYRKGVTWGSWCFGKRMPLLCISVWLWSANGLMQDALAVFPALVELTRRLSFLPVFPRSVRKLPQELRFISPNYAERRLLYSLREKNLFFSFSLLFPLTLVCCP